MYKIRSEISEFAIEGRWTLLRATLKAHKTISFLSFPLLPLSSLFSPQHSTRSSSAGQQQKKKSTTWEGKKNHFWSERRKWFFFLNTSGLFFGGILILFFKESLNTNDCCEHDNKKKFKYWLFAEIKNYIVRGSKNYVWRNAWRCNIVWNNPLMIKKS